MEIIKTRLGFVSNSSSSSFLIYGVAVGRSEIIDRYIETSGKEFTDDEIDNLDEWGIVEKMCPDLSIDIPYDSTVYIGKSWDEVKDDQTGAQFKEEVKEQLKKVFGEDIECDTYSEAWHD